MSDFTPSPQLVAFARYARERAEWEPGDGRLLDKCLTRTWDGRALEPAHNRCSGHQGPFTCRCSCHQPTARERALFAGLADEIEAFVAPVAEQDDLFGSEG